MLRTSSACLIFLFCQPRRHKSPYFPGVLTEQAFHIQHTGSWHFLRDSTAELWTLLHSSPHSESTCREGAGLWWDRAPPLSTLPGCPSAIDAVQAARTT